MTIKYPIYTQKYFAHHSYSHSEISSMADDGGGSFNVSHISDEESSANNLGSGPKLPFSTGSGGGSGSSSSFSTHTNLPPPPGFYTICPSPSADQTHEPHFIMSPALMESPRKPRGRPPGSKNKPKPPLVITKESDTAMKSVILEISAGSDVVENLIHFAHKHNLGISILSGSGSISNVTLRPPISHAPVLSLHGPFNLLSLTGTYISNNNSTPNTVSSRCSFGICLEGIQGQMFGGTIGGKVTAASLVVVVAATFKNPTFHKLPSENIEKGEEGTICIGGNENASDHQHQAIAVYNVAGPAPLNCLLPTAVMNWSPGSTSRPPF
ncbi:AT-hook motif nuclear-localized protein [Quillaja saponaria]|uniref:AT-hook motif nuclear-localized protein n=1 Tax=Quillaja saponaria TaxID=32244 RepID=A0AAD7LVB3_QUISA|nr:AT-hook motif nuclear-localized protein [Quillaja saponaria]